MNSLEETSPFVGASKRGTWPFQQGRPCVLRGRSQGRIRSDSPWVWVTCFLIQHFSQRISHLILILVIKFYECFSSWPFYLSSTLLSSPLFLLVIHPQLSQFYYCQDECSYFSRPFSSYWFTQLLISLPLFSSVGLGIQIESCRLGCLQKQILFCMGQKIRFRFLNAPAIFDKISTPVSVPVTQKGFNCAPGVLWGGRGADLCQGKINRLSHIWVFWKPQQTSGWSRKLSHHPCWGELTHG